MTITILADNVASAPYLPEHGFSAFVQSDGSGAAILFDTGMGALFANAATAGVDLSQVSDVALSHGHYDHTDALADFLERYPGARVHASSEIYRDHFSRRTGACRRIALSNENRARLSALGEGQLVLFDETDAMAGGAIHLAARIPRVHPLETPSPLLFKDDACAIPDEVPDEIVFWAVVPEGLVILTGCCHAGFINTCEHVRALSGIDRIHAVVGGFHLANASAERMQATADYIRTREIVRVVACHCTGDAETDWLRSRLGAVVTKGECGMLISL